jgi:hypothetical protein
VTTRWKKSCQVPLLFTLPAAAAYQTTFLSVNTVVGFAPLLVQWQCSSSAALKNKKLKGIECRLQFIPNIRRRAERKLLQKEISDDE